MCLEQYCVIYAGFYGKICGPSMGRVKVCAKKYKERVAFKDFIESHLD